MTIWLFNTSRFCRLLSDWELNFVSEFVYFVMLGHTCTFRSKVKISSHMILNTFLNILCEVKVGQGQRSFTNKYIVLWHLLGHAQHETDDVILYIHKHRGNSFKLQNYKMRLKQIKLNWINSMQVKNILFTNVYFSWSLCLLNMF